VIAYLGIFSTLGCVLTDEGKMKESRLSVAIITQNEETNLGACLDSVSFADEIVIVDSGSRDGTCETAKQYTDKVFFRAMKGFGDQKQYAVDKTTGDWILSLDADERVSQELRHSVLSLLKADADKIPFHGYRIYRRNVYLGRPIRYCGWYVPILRLFRKGSGRFNEKLVHEEIIVDGPVGHLEGDILHVPYTDIFHHLEKMRLYASLDAREVLSKDRKVLGWRAPIHLLGRPSCKFIEKYIIQQGFREGIHGLVLSVMAALGVFLIYAQCWHVQREQMKRRTE
jgi:glycosyltransferase involved in cell wall biosynthesis